ncbi:pilus assembly protein [Allorhizobium sp. BGMRC 0089]|uniref:TadE/TadG family type IV pilus assembly protein n=1 Tax=Allorhizobium sonneratiae TaxID=2934936 RepID=UPI002033878E|nr:TadE/TadG family type IV pilus assembly protein [Allorhizobium sonneratiae]MCM2291781.1 pilus assembly protein [Allorhizobium sonneratiae]
MIKDALKKLATDRSGMGAVEFALLVPVLLLLYLGAFELTLAMSVAQRVTATSSAIADIVALQSSTVNKSFLSTMPTVGQAMLMPYTTTGYKLKITGISVDSNLKATVAWSWSADGTVPYTAGSTWTMPTDMAVAGAFFVHAEYSVPHQIITYLPNLTSSVATINIGRDYYYRQRENDTISCSDC